MNATPSSGVPALRDARGYFAKGNPGGPGRPRGFSRLGSDLAQLILDAAAEAGFVKVEKGVRLATGEDGLLGYLRWLAVHEPRTYAGLIGRALPYQVQDTTPKHRVLSRQEVEEELKLRGLPTELLAVLRATPAPLDPGEIENPYDIELPPDGSAGTPK